MAQNITSSSVNPPPLRVLKGGVDAGYADLIPREMISGATGMVADFPVNTLMSIAALNKLTESVPSWAKNPTGLFGQSAVSPQDYQNITEAMQRTGLVNSQGHAQIAQNAVNYLGELGVFDNEAIDARRAQDPLYNFAGGAANITAGLGAGAGLFGGLAKAGALGEAAASRVAPQGAKALFSEAASRVPTEMAIGAGLGAPSALTLSTDLRTGEFHGMEFLGHNIANAAFGAVMPFVGATGHLLKQKIWTPGKQAIENISQKAKQMVQEADTVRTMQEMGRRQQEMMRMQQQAQMQRQSRSAPVEAAPVMAGGANVPPTKIPQTKVSTKGYKEVPNSRELYKTERAKMLSEVNERLAQKQKEIDILDEFITEAKEKDVLVSDKEVNAAYEGPKNEAQIKEEIRTAKEAELRADYSELQTTKKQIQETLKGENTLGEEKALKQQLKEVNKLLAEVRTQLKEPIPVTRKEIAARREIVDQEKAALREQMEQAKIQERDEFVGALEQEADKALGDYFKIQEEIGEINDILPEQKEFPLIRSSDSAQFTLPGMEPQPVALPTERTMLRSREGEAPVVAAMSKKGIDAVSFGTPEPATPNEMRRFREGETIGRTPQKSELLDLEYGPPAVSPKENTVYGELQKVELFAERVEQIFNPESTPKQKAKVIKDVDSLLKKTKPTESTTKNLIEGIKSAATATMEGLQDISSRVQSLSRPIGIKLNEHVGTLAVMPKALQRRLSKVANFKTLEKEFKTNKAAFLEGRVDDMSLQARKELEKLQPVFNEINDSLIEAGLPELPKVNGLYFPRRYDKEGLAKLRNKDSYSEKLERDKAKDLIESQDDIVTALETERKFKDSVPEEYQAIAMSPIKAMRAWSRDVARQVADSNFFGGIKPNEPVLGKGGLLDRLVSKEAPDLTSKQRETIYNDIAAYFRKPGLMSPRATKLAAAAGAAQRGLTLGRIGTAIKQGVLAIPYGMHRHGIMKGLKGLTENRVNRTQFEMDMMGDLDTSAGKLNAAVNIVGIPGFTATQIFETNKGSLAPSFVELYTGALKASKKGKATGEFKRFLDRHYLPEEHQMVINRLAKFAKDKALTPDHFTLIDTFNNSRMKGAALSKADKVRWANESGLGKALSTLLTFSIKRSNAFVDRTVGAAREGDYGTAAKNLLSAAVLLGPMEAATVTAIKEVLDSPLDFDWKKEFTKNYQNFVTEHSMPLINRYVFDQLGDANKWDDILVGSAAKGLDKGLRIAESAKKAIVSGQPLSFFDREVNKSFKDIPLAMIPEIMSKGSRAEEFRRAEIAKAERAKEDIAGKTAKQNLELSELRQYWREHSGGTESVKKLLEQDIAGKPIAAEIIERAKAERQMQEEYKIDDPRVMGVISLRKAEFDSGVKQAKLKTEQALADGTITKQQALVLLKQFPIYYARKMYEYYNEE